MRTVWKYDVPVDDEVHSHRIPTDYRIVGVGIQRPNIVTFWAEVNREREPEVLDLIVVGTGHPVPLCSEHLGLVFDGPFVWHLYGARGAKS